MLAARKRRPGRPPLPEGVGKTVQLKVKVSPSEMALADELAARYDVDRSTFIRRMLHVVASDPTLFVSSQARDAAIKQAIEKGWVRRAFEPESEDEGLVESEPEEPSSVG